MQTNNSHGAFRVTQKFCPTQSRWTSKAEITESPIKNGSRRIVKDSQ